MSQVSNLLTRAPLEVDLWFPWAAERNPLNFSSDMIRLGPLEFMRQVIISSIRHWISRGYRVRSVMIHSPYGQTFQGSTDPQVFVADSWRRLMVDGPAIWGKTKIQILEEYRTGFNELKAVVSDVKIYLGSISFLANRASPTLQAALADDVKKHWNSNFWGPAAGIFNQVCIDSSTMDNTTHAGWLVKNWLHSQGYKFGIEHLTQKTYPHWGDVGGADFSVSTHVALGYGIQDNWCIVPPVAQSTTYQLLNAVDETCDPRFVDRNIVPMFPGWRTTLNPNPTWKLTSSSSILPTQPRLT